jgi:hypothetical protein
MPGDALGYGMTGRYDARGEGYCPDEYPYGRLHMAEEAAKMGMDRTENRRKYGTPAIIMAANELGLLPTRNFSIKEENYVRAQSYQY